MGLLHWYFTAPSDEQAAAFAAEGPDPDGPDVVNLPDLDPVLILAAVEAMLTGRDEDEIDAGMLGGPDGPWVIPVTGELQRAIAAAPPGRLAEIAGAIVEDDDAWDDPEFAVDALTHHLADLGDLSRRALTGGDRVYAWVSL